MGIDVYATRLEVTTTLAFFNKLHWHVDTLVQQS
jgi:hypothetical protein